MRSGLEIIDGVADLMLPTGEPLQVRVDMATGLAVVGDIIGAEASLERHDRRHRLGHVIAEVHVRAGVDGREPGRLSSRVVHSVQSTGDVASGRAVSRRSGRSERDD